jgi:hypothetical protein
MTEFNLWDAAQWVLGGGAGPLVYWVMNEFEALVQLQPKTKRFVSLGMAAVFAWLALGVTLWMGAPIPVTPQEWVNKLFAVAFAAIVASQTLHGQRDLPA